MKCLKHISNSHSEIKYFTVQLCPENQVLNNNMNRMNLSLQIITMLSCLHTAMETVSHLTRAVRRWEHLVMNYSNKELTMSICLTPKKVDN